MSFRFLATRPASLFLGATLLTSVGCSGINDGAGTDGADPSSVGDGDTGMSTGGDGDGSGDGDSGSTTGGEPSDDGTSTGDGDSAVGGDGDGTSTGDGDGDGGIVVPAVPFAEAPDGYPEGPYGRGNPQVGDVIENVSFEGYPRIGDGVVVSTGDVETITMSDIRDLGKRYALIHTATVWCPSCRTAADDLAERGDELSAMDAVLVELVLDGPSSGVNPTNEQLGIWAVGSDITVTTVRAGDEQTHEVFPSREYAYVVDMDTMTVVWRQQALFSSPTITELGIDALLEELQ